jgi:hypothetical protein
MATLDEELAQLAILTDSTGVEIKPVGEPTNLETPPVEEDTLDEEEEGKAPEPPKPAPVTSAAPVEPVDVSDEINEFLTELDIEIPEGTEVNGASDVLNLVKGKLQAVEGKLKSYQSIPNVDELAKWTASGRPLEEFNQRPVRYDYSQFVLEGDSAEIIDLQERVVRTLMSKQGKDEDDIEDTIEMYKTKGVLELKSKDALGKIDAMNQQEVDAYNKQVEKEEKAQAKADQEENLAIQKALKDAEDMIVKGKLRGIVLTAQDRTDLIKFIKPNGNKEAPVLAAREALSTEDCLAIDYLIMKKFDFSKLVGSTSAKPTPETPKRIGGVLFGAKHSTETAKGAELTMSELQDFETKARQRYQ